MYRQYYSWHICMCACAVTSLYMASQIIQTKDEQRNKALNSRTETSWTHYWNSYFFGRRMCSSVDAILFVAGKNKLLVNLFWLNELHFFCCSQREPWTGVPTKKLSGFRRQENTNLNERKREREQQIIRDIRDIPYMVHYFLAVAI